MNPHTHTPAGNHSEFPDRRRRRVRQAPRRLEQASPRAHATGQGANDRRINPRLCNRFRRHWARPAERQTSPEHYQILWDRAWIDTVP